MNNTVTLTSKGIFKFSMPDLFILLYLINILFNSRSVWYFLLPSSLQCDFYIKFARCFTKILWNLQTFAKWLLRMKKFNTAENHSLQAVSFKMYRMFQTRDKKVKAKNFTCKLEWDSITIFFFRISKIETMTLKLIFLQKYPNDFFFKTIFFSKDIILWTFFWFSLV